VGAVIGPLVDGPPPDLGRDAPIWPLVQRAFGVRRAGTELLRDLMRIVPGSVEDGLRDLLVDPRIRAAVALGGLVGTFMGPRSPQSAGIVLLREALAGGTAPGGPAKLVQVLLAAAKANGATVRCSAPVERIRVERGTVRGVTLVGGESFEAPIVLSAVDPRRTLLDLVEARELPPRTEDEVRAIRSRATSAKLHLAVSRLPRFTDGTVERVRLARDPNHVERAFDDAKHRRLPRDPALDVAIPSVSDPSLAPAGHHVVSVHVFGVPYAPAEGWTDAARRKLVDTAVAALGRVDPDLPGSIVAAELLDPPTIEARYGVTGGHPMHGEHALDTLWFGRPSLGLASHETPIRGLFLGSAGTAPHGWPGGASGLAAARVATEER
jgi:phytoene dehydrogenase-like protein